MALSKIYLIDDASEGNLAENMKDKITTLSNEHFFQNYLSEDSANKFEAYIANYHYQNMAWNTKSASETIGNNEYTKDVLKAILEEALGMDNTIILLDYYFIDNPTDDTEVTALNFIKTILTDNIESMKNQRTRVLFYSSWPSKKMVEDIRRIENPNVYYSSIDFQRENDIVRFDLREFFRVVSEKERVKKDET
ncbi:MAG: hypothetical protein IKP88_05375 [Lachnospiraceae bacterium]|nr:hypothetical protein [Lachnospiraceae bacterium]